MKQTSKDSSQALALERYTLLSKIQELIHQGLPLCAALQQVCCCPITRPDGTQRLFARRTIEDWWYQYQHGGFAALHPKSRSDKGSPRVITAEQRQLILQQVQAQPAVPIEVLYRRWKQTDPNLPSIASIYRLLRANQLDSDSRRRQLRQPLGGATKAFETPAVNELWMADFSPGPFLHPPTVSKALATHLCLIVDDHSRLVPYAAYYSRADTQAFHQTFQQAIRRRGLPLRLYTDQGGPFTNDHTRVVCARLGIRLLHAKPYHAWSKGKVERLCSTIQQDFEVALRLPGEAVFSLEQLNSKFSHWLQTLYHTRVHSATGCSPHERYQRGAHLVRSLDPHLDLDVLFYTELVRVVRRDGTVRLGSRLYEVDLSLRALSVQLRFDPFRMDRIEVWYKAASFGLARAVDLHLNSQLLQSHPYEKPTQS